MNVLEGLLAEGAKSIDLDRVEVHKIGEDMIQEYLSTRGYTMRQCTRRSNDGGNAIYRFFRIAKLANE